MKKLTKVLAVVLAAVFVFGCFAACSNSGKTDNTSDLAYVQEKGKLIVGITEFAPMDYKDANGEWIGFDADLGRLFAKELGVDVEFLIIDWDSKSTELKTKAIDCAWNGMTITDEVKLNMSVSNAYATNQQVVVMKADKIADIKSADDLKGLKIAVENGSAGQGVANDLELDSIALENQAAALLEVNAGKSDAAIIDSTMAAAMTGEGTDYANLAAGIQLVDEEYGIGFRQESDLTEKMNEFLAKAKADGTLQKLSEQYKVTLA
ncbi:MAG: transporter substrate-binding domain-containing protein [Clostridiales bacterium]|nr:transporter substrate-binding domain-containing protein [Clostridiales bacterium]